MELQIGEISGEIPGEISVDDLRLVIRDNIGLWNWGVNMMQWCTLYDILLFWKVTFEEK